MVNPAGFQRLVMPTATATHPRVPYSCSVVDAQELASLAKACIGFWNFQMPPWKIENFFRSSRKLEGSSLSGSSEMATMTVQAQDYSTGYALGLFCTARNEVASVGGT